MVSLVTHGRETEKHATLTIRPAFSTLRANSAFSDRKPYPCVGLALEVTVRAQERVAVLTRVDHLSAMVFGNLNDLVASEISTDGGVLAALANDVGFVGLWEMVSAPAKERDLHARTHLSILCLCMPRRSS